MSTERFLDIGCGKSNHLGLDSKEGISIIGCDLREDFLRRRINAGDGGKFLVTDGHNLPFSDSSFEEACLASVLEHVINPKSVLEETFRILKPGGKIIVDVPHPRYDKVMASIAPEYHSDDFHRHTFHPQEIKELIKEVGFKIEEYSPRIWKAAFYFSFRWLRAKLRGKLEFDPDSGELLNYPESRSGKVNQWFDKLLWLSENKAASPKRFYLLSPLRWLNRIYPWVTYIEARKPPRDGNSLIASLMI